MYILNNGVLRYAMNTAYFFASNTGRSVIFIVLNVPISTEALKRGRNPVKMRFVRPATYSVRGRKHLGIQHGRVRVF